MTNEKINSSILIIKPSELELFYQAIFLESLYVSPNKFHPVLLFVLLADLIQLRMLLKYL